MPLFVRYKSDYFHHLNEPSKLLSPERSPPSPSVIERIKKLKKLCWANESLPLTEVNELRELYKTVDPFDLSILAIPKVKPLKKDPTFYKVSSLSNYLRKFDLVPYLQFNFPDRTFEAMPTARHFTNAPNPSIFATPFAFYINFFQCPEFCWYDGRQVRTVPIETLGQAKHLAMLADAANRINSVSIVSRFWGNKPRERKNAVEIVDSIVLRTEDPEVIYFDRNGYMLCTAWSDESSQIEYLRKNTADEIVEAFSYTNGYKMLENKLGDYFTRDNGYVCRNPLDIKAYVSDPNTFTVKVHAIEGTIQNPKEFNPASFDSIQSYLLQKQCEILETMGIFALNYKNAPPPYATTVGESFLGEAERIAFTYPYEIVLKDFIINDEMPSGVHLVMAVHEKCGLTAKYFNFEYRNLTSEELREKIDSFKSRYPRIPYNFSEHQELLRQLNEAGLLRPATGKLSYCHDTRGKIIAHTFENHEYTLYYYANPDRKMYSCIDADNFDTFKDIYTRGFITPADKLVKKKKLLDAILEVREELNRLNIDIRYEKKKVWIEKNGFPKKNITVLDAESIREDVKLYLTGLHH